MYRLASRLKISFMLALLLVVASVTVASAQEPAYDTDFVTSVTYQNVGTGDATVSFNFYQELEGTPVQVSRSLPQGAGSSLFLGSLSGSEALPNNFLGSAVLSADQPIVATLVQIPDSTTVVNRPLSNGFKDASPNILFATVLKTIFDTHSVFSVQNASNNAIDISVDVIPVPGSGGSTVNFTQDNIPVGAAKYFDMNELSGLGDSFNGSARVSATVAESDNPANIVGSVTELSVTATDAKAFEAVTGGSSQVFVASALCNAFGGQQTAYAIQNTDDANTADVTVNYSDGSTDSANIDPGAKASILGCDALPAGFNGSSTINSTGGEIVVIGKVFGAGLNTAFLGEPAGSNKLALPYVRWATDANYAPQSEGGQGFQRTFIAIQNIGGSTVNNVAVRYLDKNGDVSGTHTIASIGAGAKANSTAADAGSGAPLDNFGTPLSNPGGGFGGAVVIEAPDGSELIAVARVATQIGGGQTVAEDYNGIAID